MGRGLDGVGSVGAHYDTVLLWLMRAASTATGVAAHRPNEN